MILVRPFQPEVFCDMLSDHNDMFSYHIITRSYKPIQLQTSLGNKKNLKTNTGQFASSPSFACFVVVSVIPLSFRTAFQQFLSTHRTIIKFHYTRKKNLVIPLRVGLVSLLRRKKQMVQLQSTIPLNSLNKREGNTSCQKRNQEMIRY